MSRFQRPRNCEMCKSKSTLFEALNKEELDAVKESCMIITFRKGEIVAKQGTPATHSLYIANGLVKIFIEGRKHNIIIKLLGKGNFLGLHSLFADYKYYNFTATALEDTEVCLIPQDVFHNLAKTNPEFLSEIVRNISNTTSMVFDKVFSLCQKGARERLMDTLLYFAEEIYKSYEFILPITRKELAELCSISTENAVRILTELKKEGLIEINGKEIKILQPEILKRLV